MATISTINDDTFNFIFKCTGKNRTQDESVDDDDDDDQKIQRRSKVSSICINLPAAGLGQRPPSIHSSVTTDEGGFNEPSPQIKALSPTYDFDITNSSHPDVISSSNVTYVDLAHRIQPEGIESDQAYDENESYRRKVENGNEIIKEKVVYATIKPEIPMVPVKELLYEKENILDEDTDPDVTDRGYISPQKILDPTKPRLHQDDDFEEFINKKLPPEPLGGSETEEEEVELPPAPLKAKKIPPPVPELNSPLDLQDVVFADASDNEENDDANKRNEEEEIIPDAMTHDEAERLLSSRLVIHTPIKFIIYSFICMQFIKNLVFHKIEFIFNFYHNKIYILQDSILINFLYFTFHVHSKNHTHQKIIAIIFIPHMNPSKKK